MPDQAKVVPSISSHGATRLAHVDVESYNVELKDDEGFVGDRASKRAFRAIIEHWRKPLRDLGHDPFGDEASDAITKKQLDGLLAAGDPEAAGIVQGAIEEFAQRWRWSRVGFSSSRAGRRSSALSLGAAFRAAALASWPSAAPR
jgi:hypothetical protein